MRRIEPIRQTSEAPARAEPGAEADAEPGAEPADDRRFRLFLACLLLAITAWGIADLVLDRPSSWLGAHVLLELAFVALCLGSTIQLARGLLRTRRSLDRISRSLGEHRAERDAWRSRTEDLLAGLGHAIDSQFEEWRLTPVEKETALYLLKGFSHKETARLAGKSERTVRQHAVAVYRKSGLQGRAELAAFFLEDLLLPAAGGDPGKGEAGSGDGGVG